MILPETPSDEQMLAATLRAMETFGEWLNFLHGQEATEIMAKEGLPMAVDVFAAGWMAGYEAFRKDLADA